MVVCWRSSVGGCVVVCCSAKSCTHDQRVLLHHSRSVYFGGRFVFRHTDDCLSEGDLIVCCQSSVRDCVVELVWRQEVQKRPADLTNSGDDRLSRLRRDNPFLMTFLCGS